MLISEIQAKKVASPGQRQYKKELRRAQRLCSCLNKAIRSGNRDKIRHWQKLGLSFYSIPISEWEVSQVDRNAGA